MLLKKVGEGASLLAQMVMNLPAMQETWVHFLSWEDSPGEKNGYPLKCFCLENHTEGPNGLSSPWGHKESDTTE